ncbi:hypothetical protein D9M71_272650 [compost metagenome]
MNYGGDHGLEAYQIEQRNQLIDDISTGLRNFDEAYALELTLERFTRPLEPGLSSNVVIVGTQPVYDEAWVYKQRDYIRNDLINYLSKQILRGVDALDRRDYRLRGSAYAIALKLCTSHPLKQRTGFADERTNFRLDCETGRLALTFDDIVDRVSEGYEREFMTYRLWNDKSLELLAQFLFSGEWDSTVFEYGALWEELDSEGEPVSLESFIESVDQTIFDLPMEHMTEASFPDYSGIVFTEYVPAQNMSPVQKEQLYQQYVSLLATDRSS